VSVCVIYAMLFVVIVIDIPIQCDFIPVPATAFYERVLRLLY